MGARLLFFGRFRDIGPSLERAPDDCATLADLRAWIAREAPDLAQALADKKAQIAIDGEIVRDETIAIAAAREIAFLPPMSGG